MKPIKKYTQERDRLLGVLDLPERMVEEIMLHRSQIEMIDADDPPKKILEKCLKSPYTRIPIFKDHHENVVGILHAKDLLRKTSILSSIGSKRFDMKKFDIMKYPCSIVKQDKVQIAN